jgi:hypothetical protein
MICPVAIVIGEKLVPVTKVWRAVVDATVRVKELIIVTWLPLTLPIKTVRLWPEAGALAYWTDTLSSEPAGDGALEN